MLNKYKSRYKILEYRLLSKLFHFIKPYQLVFYILIFLTLVIGIVEPSRPYMIQIAIDKYIALKDHTGLLVIILWMLGLLFLQTLSQYILVYLSDWLGQHVVKDIRTKIYTHVIQLNATFHNNTPVGRLVMRNISDTEKLLDVFSHDFAAVLADLLQLIAMAAFMFYINWKLALLSLTTVPLLIAGTYLFKKKIARAYKEVNDVAVKLNSFIQSRITGISIIQIFNREDAELINFKMLNEAYRNANDKSNKYYSLYYPSLEIMRAIGMSLLIWYGAKGVINQVTTLGSLTAFLMYIKMFFRPVSHLAEHFNTLQMGLVSSSRIMELLDNQEIVKNTGTYQPQHIQGNISFKGVWFAYKGQDYILKDLTFEVAAYKSLAIVGATGAGKSTTINLLERFYEPQKGIIEIDGVNILDYEIHSLRKHIGLVLQDVFLFSATIYENITLGDPTISKERVVEAAKIVGMHTFIQQLPGNYDYKVGERGISLSMGQRQLLAFARVLVYNPSIIILDEATASLDTESEKLIQQATLTVLANRTAIIIAHRLSTIQHADDILVLDKGEIKEQGAHQSLLAKDGYYAALHKVQQQIA
ncbi:MAG: ABC transporter ATP-binding protein [Candidatus Amoebophilus sp.]